MMNPAEFANIARAEQDFWWYRGMRQILFRGFAARSRPVAAPDILRERSPSDTGCGCFLSIWGGRDCAMESGGRGPAGAGGYLSTAFPSRRGVFVCARAGARAR